jgi:ketosteroid isomerase-like protein
MEEAMTEQDVQNWLDEYGRAWVNGDPDHVVTLFSETATYRLTPFDDPMRGRPEIREYWQNGAADAQENVEFASQVWAVKNDTAIAGWQARFTLKASGVREELDGTFRLVFSNEQGTLQCTILEEWWHSRES